MVFYPQLGRPHPRQEYLCPGGGGLAGARLAGRPEGLEVRGGKAVGDAVVKSVTVKADSITIKGTGTYTLNEAAQHRVATQLHLGSVSWCADAPAKAGNPPPTGKNDLAGKFVAQPKTPAPIACPGEPGSPSGAFLDVD